MKKKFCIQTVIIVIGFSVIIYFLSDLANKNSSEPSFQLNASPSALTFSDTIINVALSHICDKGVQNITYDKGRAQSFDIFTRFQIAGCYIDRVEKTEVKSKEKELVYYAFIVNDVPFMANTPDIKSMATVLFGLENSGYYARETTIEGKVIRIKFSRCRIRQLVNNEYVEIQSHSTITVLSYFEVTKEGYPYTVILETA